MIHHPPIVSFNAPKSDVVGTICLVLPILDIILSYACLRLHYFQNLKYYIPIVTIKMFCVYIYIYASPPPPSKKKRILPFVWTHALEKQV